MALTPDSKRADGGVAVNVKIIPWGAVWAKDYGSFKAGDKYKADRLLSNGEGKVKGVTIHNTDATANAETYTRATYPNQNMKDARVHYYVDDCEAWQNLQENEVGWHSGDGRGDGNETTIAIEIIMNGAAVKDNAKAEDNGARLAAAILARHGLTVADLYTHNRWMGLPDAITAGARKNCPLYILPHWTQFKAKVAGYLAGMAANAPAAAPPPTQAAPPVDTSALTAIAGASVATAGQMRAYLAKQNPAAPDYAALYLEEGQAEGIRGDVAFAQALLETGNFKFGGDVKPDQNNFCGLGATGGGNPGNNFTTPQEGIRAQVQHLKAYATTDAPSGALVDLRFNLVKRGCAPYVEWLGQKENPTGAGWATGANYGAKITNILAGITATNAPPEQPAPPPQQTAPDTPPPADNPAANPPAAAPLDNEPRPWEKVAVEKAVQRGIITGDERGDLMLHRPATRADVLVFLERTGIL